MYVHYVYFSASFAEILFGHETPDNIVQQRQNYNMYSVVLAMTNRKTFALWRVVIHFILLSNEKMNLQVMCFEMAIYHFTFGLIVGHI